VPSFSLEMKPTVLPFSVAGRTAAVQ
jgi:hypothetical protein